MPSYCLKAGSVWLIVLLCLYLLSVQPMPVSHAQTVTPAPAETLTATITPSVPQTVDDLLTLMRDSHTRYDRLYIQYRATMPGGEIQHRVWLDDPGNRFRYDVVHHQPDSQRTMYAFSDGEFIYQGTLDGNDDITLELPPDPQNLPLANQHTGRIGTLISPGYSNSRLENSELALRDTETLMLSVQHPEDDDTDDPSQTFTTVQLEATLPDSAPQVLWVDVETGIVVKEVIYRDDDTVFSTTILEALVLDPDIDDSIFSRPDAESVE